MIIKMKNQEIIYTNIIQGGSPFLIFAYGLTDPEQGQDIGYHESRRGSKVANLISSPVDKDFEIPNVETFDMTIANVKLTYFKKLHKSNMNQNFSTKFQVIIPKEEDTYYYCTAFKIPDNFMSPKRHILKVNNIITQLCKKDLISYQTINSGNLFYLK